MRFISGFDDYILFVSFFLSFVWKFVWHDKDEPIAALPIDELIEKADGFNGVFPKTNGCAFINDVD